MSVEFLKADRGEDVIVRGRRVPMLEARMLDGGGVFITFDRRLGLRLTAENYEGVVAFLSDVMENVMQPECGRTFNRMVEITGASRDQTGDLSA